MDELLRENGVIVKCSKCAENISVGNLCVTHVKICCDCCGC